MIRSVKVGPHSYAIRTDRRASDDYGETFLDRCEIVVSSKQGPSQRRETVLHEILHACSSLTGLRVEMGEGWDESMCTRMAPVLLDVLRRNPRLVEFLTEP